MSAETLNKAAARMDDEWFTPRGVISREVEQYGDWFRGKRILMNCNDSNSEFYWYFRENHSKLQWRQMAASSFYVSRVIYYDEDGRHDVELPGGNYEHFGARELLDKSDVVVTNPPFSLTRQFIRDMLFAEKDLLCINAVTNVLNKDLFPYFLSGKLRFGYGNAKGVYKHKSGEERYFGNLVWFTTLPVKRPFFHSGAKIEDRAWKRYDIFPDVIHIERCSHIPMNYDGVMGVPVTFLQHHNPEQFVIVDARTMTDDKRFLDADMGFMGAYYVKIDGKHPFSRIFIKRKHPCYADDGKVLW